MERKSHGCILEKSPTIFNANISVRIYRKSH